MESPDTAREPLLRPFWLAHQGVQRSTASVRETRVDGLRLRRWGWRRRLESPDVHGKPVLRNVRRSYLSLLQENQGGWALLSGVVVFSETERSGSATAGIGVAWKRRLNGRWLQPVARSVSSVRTVPARSGVCTYLRTSLSQASVSVSAEACGVN